VAVEIRPGQAPKLLHDLSYALVRDGEADLSARQPVVPLTVYLEPRYNPHPDLQFYAGLSAERIAFPNRAAVQLSGCSKFDRQAHGEQCLCGRSCRPRHRSVPALAQPRWLPLHDPADNRSIAASASVGRPTAERFDCDCERRCRRTHRDAESRPNYRSNRWRRYLGHLASSAHPGADRLYGDPRSGCVAP